MLSFSAFFLLALKTALIVAFIYFTFIRKRKYTLLPEHPLILIINILGILYLTELVILLMMHGMHKETWDVTLTPAIHDIFIPVGIVIIYLTLIRPYITKQHDNIDLINDNIQEAIIVMNMGGDIYYTNKTAEKMFGYTKNEIHKIRSNTLLTLPDADDQNNASWLNLKTLTSQRQTELKGHRKDGTSFHAKVMTNSVITGNKVIFVSIIQDISEQKKAEQKLQKSSKQFRDFFYLNPEACTISTMKGILIDVNQATLDLSEYSREELIGRNVSDIPAWQNHKDQLDIFKELIQKGKINNRETIFRKKSGNTSEALYSAQIIEVDGESMILSITRDITERKKMEEENSYLASIVQSTNDAVIGIDDNCTVLSWNKGAEKIYGYTADEMLGKSIRPIMPDDVWEGRKEMILDATRGKTIENYETKRIKKDGSIIDISLTLSVIKDKHGKMISLSSITRDITEKKQTEDKLKQSEEKYHSVVEVLTEGIVMQGRDGKIYTYNDSALRILGLSAEQITGKTSVDPSWHAIHEDGSTFPGETHPAMISLETGRPLFGVIMGVHKPDGTLSWISINSQPLFRDGQTQAYAVVTSFADITERKNAEDKLKNSEQRYKLISENVNDVIWTLSLATGKFTFVSPSVYKLRGYTPEEVLEQTMQEALIPEHYQQIATLLPLRLAAIQSGDKSHVTEINEVDQPRKDGSIVSTEVSTTILTDANGAPVEILGVSRDITERRKAQQQLMVAKEEAESANRAKSDFLAHMSHEIRTPMNTTLGAVELLSETKLTQEQKQYVDMFKRSSEHLLSLINDILDISKIEAGHLELEYIDFDICHLCDDIIDIMSIRAKDKNLSIKYETSMNCPTRLIGDPHRLEQILINLVGNAIKFTQSGEIKISIEPTGTQPDKNKTELLFRISDTGIGIPPERIHTIFQSFSQAESSTTRQYGGTGLGLSISKSLVELMNGKIWVESTPGKGSTFSFTAIFGISESIPEIIEKKTKEPKTLKLTKKLSILLVDDSEDNREIIKLYLRDQPVTIEIAENGLIAVSKAKTNTYDVILMDLQMPIMDGYAATAEIRQWEKENNKTRTPIVALSANAFREHQQRAAEVGCDNYIVKPVKKGKLIEILATIL